jgi:hypothetical protein
MLNLSIEDTREIMRKFLAAIITLSCLSAVPSQAQRIRWSAPTKYDTGEHPSVSMNSSGVVIEAHEALVNNHYALYYHVGKLDRSNGVVTWGKSQLLSTKTDARFPSVAITENSSVIVVFDTGTLRLRYITGTLNPTGPVDQAINIVVPDTQYDTGRTPQVSVNASGTLIEVHQNNLSDCKLFYRIGYVYPETNAPNIAWRSEAIQYEIGNTPRVSLDDQSIFVEVHREKSGSNIHYRRGTISNNQASFGPSYFLSDVDKTGSYPSVAVTSSGFAVALVTNSGDIQSQDGPPNPLVPSKISWTGARQTIQSGGTVSSVSTDSDWIVAAWGRGGPRNYELQYSTARVP